MKTKSYSSPWIHVQNRLVMVWSITMVVVLVLTSAVEAQFRQPSSATVKATRASQQAGALIPGTGQQVTQVGDDFEDPEWNYVANLPKVYNNKDTTLASNAPGGYAANQRWYEGMKRGQPDLIRRVPTPAGGLPGSTGALEIRSLRTGGPNPTYVQQQEDLIADITSKIGKISADRGPSVVTRVWLPPIEQWVQRTGCHFAFRLALEDTTRYAQVSHRNRSSDQGVFWPGIFVNLSRNPQAKPGTNPYYLDFWMKATANGRRIQGPRTLTTGWWTMGMSVSADGKVHYFAKPGIEDLTLQDHIASDYPFGRRTARMRTFFFNVCNGDDGRTWSTPVVIDDSKLFLAR